MTFWSWDDGYDGTWEGEIYGERYSDGAWHLMEGQANIETETMYAVWANDVGHEGPGGPYEVKSRGARAYGGIRLASLGGPAPLLTPVMQSGKTPKRLASTSGSIVWQEDAAGSASVVSRGVRWHPSAGSGAVQAR